MTTLSTIKDIATQAAGKGISVRAGGDRVLLNSADKDALKAAYTRVADALIAAKTGRRLTNVRNKGSKIWCARYSDGYATGRYVMAIGVELSADERRAQVLGSSPW